MLSDGACHEHHLLCPGHWQAGYYLRKNHEGRDGPVSCTSCTCLLIQLLNPSKKVWICRQMSKSIYNRTSFVPPQILLLLTLVDHHRQLMRSACLLGPRPDALPPWASKACGLFYAKQAQRSTFHCQLTGSIDTEQQWPPSKNVEASGMVLT